MIHITQGHQRSISLEVFLKALLLISPARTNNLLCLYCSRSSLELNLKQLFSPLSYSLKDDRLNFFGHSIKLKFIAHNDLPESTRAIELALSSINEGEVLLTLPTSKDQLVLNGSPVLGHTEYLRHYFKNDELPMFFRGIRFNSLLITDHIPLKNVSESVTKKLIVTKTQNTIDGYQLYFDSLNEVLFSGLNPHSGEGGLLGDEDNLIREAISELKSLYPSINFKGPYPADTIHLHQGKNHDSFTTYLYHDQGLSTFKLTHRFIGANITFGLPFLRLSPDHGTAFDLWGKNMANCLGCHDTLLIGLNSLDR